jgi:hypothetical protein
VVVFVVVIVEFKFILMLGFELLIELLENGIELFLDCNRLL